MAERTPIQRPFYFGSPLAFAATVGISGIFIFPALNWLGGWPLLSRIDGHWLIAAVFWAFVGYRAGFRDGQPPQRPERIDG